jgi:hypothetical protein
MLLGWILKVLDWFIITDSDLRKDEDRVPEAWTDIAYREEETRRKQKERATSATATTPEMKFHGIDGSEKQLHETENSVTQITTIRMPNKIIKVLREQGIDLTLK